MNDLDLHSRLSGLADDLAPDADPYAQADGARALHRRRQRTRLGVAGVALAVALVAVGVPTAVGTLSAPRGVDGAGPSASEALRGPASAVRAGMAWWQEDGSVPDPEAGTPCPDAAPLLSGMDSSYQFEASRSNSGGTLTGCSWSTDERSPTADTRIDLMLTAAHDLDADLLASNLESDAVQEGCDFTTLFPDLPPNVLQVCEGTAARVWHVTVVDEDGTGAWRLTAAVGTDVDAAFRIGATSVATLWGIVSGFHDAGPGVQEDEVGPLDAAAESLRADLGALVPASVPDPALDVSCPDAAVRLSEATGTYTLAPGRGNADARTSDGCYWSLAGGQTSAADALGLELRSDPALDQETLTRQYDAERNRGGCHPSAMPGTVGFSALLVCEGEAGTSWTLTMLADDGVGGWVLTVNAGAELPEAFDTAKASVLALQEVVVGGL